MYIYKRLTDFFTAGSSDKLISTIYGAFATTPVLMALQLPAVDANWMILWVLAGIVLCCA